MNTSDKSREMQLDRALDYESRGQGFESSQARQTLNKSAPFFVIKF